MSAHLLRRLGLSLIAALSLFASPTSPAQFIEDFRTAKARLDPKAIDGWSFYTGDGNARMDFRQGGKGHASIFVDARQDKRGIWWALIRRLVSRKMNLALLSDPRYALRVEARIKVSDAPKRVNLHLNMERTTDFHSHVMEYDIPDTTTWHTISMTTRRFDAVPGDSVYGQLALMDWGLGVYRVDLQYFRVDIVNVDSAGPDKGFPLPYHPPIPPPDSFVMHLPADQRGTIDREYPDMSFARWAASDTPGRPLLAVSGTQEVILRWNFGALGGKKATGAGVLELTTYALQRADDKRKDFGMVRVSEIIGGDPLWDEAKVTYHSLLRGSRIERVINSQMIIDVEAAGRRGDATLVTISLPVLQRLIDGTTLGLALRPLGAVSASFYRGDRPHRAPTLHFTLDTASSGDNR